MDKALLTECRKNRKELERTEKSLKKLNERLDTVQIVSGKVKKSNKNFPYTEGHLVVEMKDPKEADPIEKRIAEKKRRRRILRIKVRAAEKFIEDMPEGIEKDVLEMLYLDGMTQREVAHCLGYTQARISQIVSGVTKDL